LNSSPNVEQVAQEQRRQQEASFELLVRSVRDYAIFMLDPLGRIASWNEGAERIKGYSADEILGKSFRTFYADEAVQSGFPQYDAGKTKQDGRFEDEGWRLRKDGSRSGPTSSSALRGPTVNCLALPKSRAT
jgi:PAS domain S-box-containing protein